MVSSFNIVSYLAGLTDMNPLKFLLATSVGIIPEAALYAFIGNEIKTIHLKLYLVFVSVLILAGLGLIASFIMVEVANVREKK